MEGKAREIPHEERLRRIKEAGLPKRLYEKADNDITLLYILLLLIISL